LYELKDESEELFKEIDALKRQIHEEEENEAFSKEKLEGELERLKELVESA